MDASSRVSPLRQRMIDDMRMRKLSEKTQGHYLRWVQRFAVEYATLEWVDWFNHRRLLEPIGNVPPAELEMTYCREHEELAMAA